MFKKTLILFLYLSSISASYGETAPQSVDASGKFGFDYIDESGELVLGKFLDSTREITGASQCIIQLIAEDDYFNFYPGSFLLTALPNGIVAPMFKVQSRYVDENGQYWQRKISAASVEVAGLSTDKTWVEEQINDQFVMLDVNIDKGVEMFHHITMGQPVKIVLERPVSPNKVTINVTPINSKSAGQARMCLKVIHGEGDS